MERFMFRQFGYVSGPPPNTFGKTVSVRVAGGKATPWSLAPVAGRFRRAKTLAETRLVTPSGLQEIALDRAK
ncbi:UNVERIFIED_CONTAM: hypothetical protein PYX00_002617 [Menopon gallinae]|uniref:Uncharacterized protein n=1 Tax=Menopon gallinae TaxID=328185 RepID=A0AAW2HXK3_9NEOP